MAFELITGRAGRNHVDSADMGEAFAGIVGKGRYILDTGEGMACAMSDSNTLTVGTGSMLMDGRIVRNETAATFKIANGTQGQYRHDLACLRYTLDRSNDSIESVEQVVLQGTPATTASEAKDPEYEAGDILSGDLSATVPIARVKLDNLTPTCEAMLGSVTSLKSLGDSVSQITQLWYKSLNTDVAPSVVTFTAPGGLDSYDYLVFFGKTSEWKRVSATLSRDNSFDNQYFQLAAPYAPTGGTDIYERMTGYKLTFSGESVTVSPKWYNEVHFSASGCDVSKGKGVPLYEVVGVRRLP